MEFKEINVPECIVQQIDHKRPFASVTIDVRNGDNIYSYVNFDVLTAISKRKMAFMHVDMNENEALIKAEFEKRNKDPVYRDY